MLMAKVVTDLANRTPGKEAVAMESFAKALRMVRTFCLLSFKASHTLTGNPVEFFGPFLWSDLLFISGKVQTVSL